MDQDFEKAALCFLRSIKLAENERESIPIEDLSQEIISAEPKKRKAVRNWILLSERTIKDESLFKSIQNPIFFTTTNGSVLSIFSVSKCSKLAKSTNASKPIFATQFTYDPSYLDERELRTEKHRTELILPGLITSTVQYTPPKILKRELNAQFRLKYPDIDASLTLSQIRRVKQRLIEIAEELDLEFSTVGMAYVYFEKLILQGKVVKANRNLIGACCLILASKINDAKDLEFPKILQYVARKFGLSHQILREAEFEVFSFLEFNLHILQREYVPHLEKIFTTLEFSNIQEYLGEKMCTLWEDFGIWQ